MVEEVVIKKRRPWLAGLLSLLFPGLGQLYNRNTRLARPLLVAIILAPPGAWFVAAVPPAAGLAAMIAVVGGFLALLIFAVVQSVLQARRIGAIQLAWFNRWYIYAGLYLLLLVTRFVLEGLPISTVQSYSTPSSGMSPTIVIGDRMEAKTNAFGNRLPERGEIALYELAAKPEVTFIKRVIGRPGDRLQWRTGRLYLNDVPVERRRVEDFVLPSDPAMPVAQFEEILPGGRTYRVIEIAGDLGEFDDTEVFEVPAGHVFVAGDNRDGSMDSHTGQGFIPLEGLRDKPLFLYWSHDLSRIGRVIE
jgi:signal peptidase I